LVIANFKFEATSVFSRLFGLVDLTCLLTAEYPLDDFMLTSSGNQDSKLCSS